jgi:hypothetical protein
MRGSGGDGLHVKIALVHIYILKDTFEHELVKMARRDVSSWFVLVLDIASRWQYLLCGEMVMLVRGSLIRNGLLQQGYFLYRHKARFRLDCRSNVAPSHRFDEIQTPILQ